MNENKLKKYSIVDLMEYFDKSRGTIKKMIDDGSLKSIRIGSSYFVTETELTSFVKQGGCSR